MYGAKRLDHTNSLFSTIACLKMFRYYITKNIIIYVQSLLQLFVIKRSFVRRETTHSSRASHDLKRLRFRSTVRSVYLCVYGVRLWNSQSDYIKMLII